MMMNRRVLSRSLLWAVPLLLPLFGAACNRSRPVPPGPGGLPAQTAQASGGGETAANLVHQPTGEAGELPPGHPALPAGGTAMPADHPGNLHGAGDPSAGGAAAAGDWTGESVVPALPDLSKSLAGSLKLTDKTRGKVTPGETIFLVARSFIPSGGPGQVLAVKRMTAGNWPLSFELTSSDVMLEGSSLNGKVVVTARVDQDGDAMTKMPGDVEGTSKPITVPAKDIEVLLDTVRTEASAPLGGMGGQGAMPGMPGGMGHP
jgi:hypothetical protein